MPTWVSNAFDCPFKTVNESRNRISQQLSLFNIQKIPSSTLLHIHLALGVDSRVSSSWLWDSGSVKAPKDI